jgi:hypothetical protein
VVLRKQRTTKCRDMEEPAAGRSSGSEYRAPDGFISVA